MAESTSPDLRHSSPPPLYSPRPGMIRTVSVESVEMRHPTPDLQSLQGAYVGNVERLEQEAERLSIASSDLGEEIRRLREEHEQILNAPSSPILRSPAVSRSGSQRSLQGTRRPVTGKASLTKTRSRKESTSSYSNSIVEVNGMARWGGYSPGGFIGSPTGSLRSGSWSKPIALGRTASSAGRLSQLPEPEQEGRPLDSPLTSSFGAIMSREFDDWKFTDETGDVLDERDEDEAKQALTRSQVRNETERDGPTPHQEEQKLEDGPEEPAMVADPEVPDLDDTVREFAQIDFSKQPAAKTKPPSTDADERWQQRLMSFEFKDNYADDEPPEDEPRQERAHVLDRPSSAASGDTYQQARRYFHDFDGVHYVPSVRGLGIDEEWEQNEGASKNVPKRYTITREQILAQPSSQAFAEPPPADDMVYYPAPVPRMLNLPKRLSQLPPQHVIDKRRSQVMEAMTNGARNSTIFLGDERPNSSDSNPDAIDNHESPGNRKSVASRLSMPLPPQLRASAFFDHPGMGQDVEVKGESAVQTLDSILEASATAPVNAFTDHPLAGPTKGIYSKEAVRKSVTNLMKALSKDKEGETSDAAKHASKAGTWFGRRKSATNLLAEVDAEEEGEVEEHGEKDSEAEHEFEDESQMDESTNGFAPPTTLLAELQARKHLQKSRNRNAASANPAGMHSTLLQLDAVAEIEKRRRQGHRVPLAWEDPQLVAAEQEAEDDEDVPLGVLFPVQKPQFQSPSPGADEWDKPLGLIAEREREDNEPLSSRRNRLKGIRPKQQETVIEAQTAEDPEEEEEETLGQRARRLKTRDTLNKALAPRPISQDFASEMYSQFGGLDDSAEDKKPSDSPNQVKRNSGSDAEEETLGQRRKRLQAEALLAGNPVGQTSTEETQDLVESAENPAPKRPDARRSGSLGDLLLANPVGLRTTDPSRHELKLAEGTLLAQNENKISQHKSSIFEKNNFQMRNASSGTLLGQINTPSGIRPDGTAGKEMRGFASGMFNDGMGGNRAALPQAAGPSAGIGAPPLPRMSTMPNLPSMTNGPAYTTLLGAGNPPPYNSINPQSTYLRQPNVYSGSGLTMSPSMNNMGSSAQPHRGMNAMYPPYASSFNLHAPPTNMHPGMPMQMGMNMNMLASMQASNEEMMDPRQRAMIDRWRQSIM